MSASPAPTLPDLIDAWEQAAADLRAAAAEVGEDGWRAPSALPGWSVADVIAHVSWIERHLLGRVDPPHEPDWDALPHAASPLGRLTETPVDLRRSWSRDAVLAEYDEAVAARAQVLRSGPQDLDAPAMDPFGRARPLAAVLRMRIFDCWVHSQDVRRATHRPGGTDTAAAGLVAEQIAGGLGYVWGKKVGAPVGSALTVRVTPPGAALVRSVGVGEDGRGRPIPPPESATVTLQMSFDDFVQLGCGRVWPDSSTKQARTRVVRSGDAGLAERVLDELNVAP